MRSIKPFMRQPGLSNQGNRRIGLISPYSGGNLGSTAIIASMIASIRKRVADAEIVGITLNPEDTRDRLGIEAFPLSGHSRPFYTLVTPSVLYAQESHLQTEGRLRKWAKRVPLVRTVLRVARTCVLELRYAAKAIRFARTLDQVIVTGGGALDESWGGPWGHPWSLLKWGLISRVAGSPMLFVSVGKSLVETRLGRCFIGSALRLANYRSYRDIETKVWVESLLDASADQVYPDIAFSYPRTTPELRYNRDSKADRLVIGVSPIAYCDPRAWPRGDERQYRKYLKHMADVVKWLLREGHRVVMFTTDSPDIVTAREIQAMIPESNLIETLPGSTEQSVDTFLDSISRVDVTIASRLHAIILSHLNATPVCALSFDPKVDAHMNRMQRRDYCLNIHDFFPQAVIDRLNSLKAARHTESAHLRTTGMHFRQLLDEQYDRVLIADGSMRLHDRSVDEGNRSPSLQKNNADSTEAQKVGG